MIHFLRNFDFLKNPIGRTSVFSIFFRQELSYVSSGLFRLRNMILELLVACFVFFIITHLSCEGVHDLFVILCAYQELGS